MSGYSDDYEFMMGMMIINLSSLVGHSFSVKLKLDRDSGKFAFYISKRGI